MMQLMLQGEPNYTQEDKSMSSGIKISVGSNFSRTFESLKKLNLFSSYKLISILDKYGQEGLKALQTMTPKDTGLTADSWSYEISTDKDVITLAWKNTNVQNGIPIAVLIQYGHATKNGGYVQGIDYINPAMHPIFKQIAESAWKEVGNL